MWWMHHALQMQLWAKRALLQVTELFGGRGTLLWFSFSGPLLNLNQIGHLVIPNHESWASRAVGARFNYCPSWQMSVCSLTVWCDPASLCWRGLAEERRPGGHPYLHHITPRAVQLPAPRGLRAQPAAEMLTWESFWKWRRKDLENCSVLRARPQLNKSFANLSSA